MQIDVEDLSKKCGYVFQVKDPKANTYNRGNVLTHLMWYEKAIEPFNKAIELRRFHENAWINKGILLSDKFHKPEEAIKCYEEALYVDPDNPSYLTLKALSLAKLKRYQEAITIYNELLKLQPLNGRVWWYKARAHERKGEYQEEKFSEQRVKQIDPTLYKEMELTEVTSFAEFVKKKYGKNLKI